MKTEMTKSLDWMRQMAKLEEGCCVSAGGLPATAGMLRPAEGRQEGQPSFDPRRVALARFVELSRRKLRLSVEDFAGRADVDPSEVLQIEDSDAPPSEPRVVFAIAQLLQADAKKLMELAGHVTSRDEQLGREAVRFAAWSQGAEPLTQDEERILGEFARVVVAATD
ncbi:MAG: helix-turn-helix domain-containing protein [Phycisphaerales bacterium]|nr:helix-turn-helix domain-containing protein [Phycisphaerales bacterium]